MKKVAEKVNESKRQLDGFHKLVEIQNSIHPPNFLVLDFQFILIVKKLVEVHRKFVREGKLLKLWGSDIQEFHFFLFNGYLLLIFQID